MLLDAGRTRVLADPEGRARAALHPLLGLRQRLPGVPPDGRPRLPPLYAGPIGAILQPQLTGEHGAEASLPFASTLCGACADVCPVRIDIPSHPRARAREGRAREARPGLEGRALHALGRAFSSAERYERAQRLARVLQRPALRDGWIRLAARPARRLGALARRSPASPTQTFREWWETRERDA